MKKIISTLIVLAMLITCLCSCDLLGAKSAEEILAEADAALDAKPYTVTTAIEYLFEDEAMGANVGSPVIRTEVDGDDFRIAMSLDGESAKNGVIYTYVDGVLYTQLSENGITSNVKETIDEETKTSLTSNYGTIVSIEDFDEVDVKSAFGSGIITCSSIKSETIAEMTAFLSEQLDLGGAHVAIKDAVLVITTMNGMYVSNIFTCQYVITTETGAYNLTMVYASVYENVTEFEITAPEF